MNEDHNYHRRRVDTAGFVLIAIALVIVIVSLIVGASQ